ncbi:MAG TPA: diguanylate cyclase [Acidimicrobiales bacterium]|nr:diguanylate cyclase [Acidimicrobiales bacterium]
MSTPLGAMVRTRKNPHAGDTPRGDEGPVVGPGPGHDGRAPKEGAPRWRPGVRFILVLVVALPILSTGILTASGAAGGWAYRQNAQVVARDAAQLQTVAAARAQMNPLEVPMLAVSYAAQIGISEPLLDTLLKPAVPYRVQIAEGTAKIAGFPTFSSTPILRADVAGLKRMIPKVAANTISFTDARAYTVKMSVDVDNLWYRDYNRMLADISTWQPPGSFEVHAAALRQAYEAFLSGGHEVDGAIFVLEGIGPADAKQELIQAAGQYDVATTEFAGHLSPRAAAAWNVLQQSPADRHFEGTIQQGLTVALNGQPAPFVDNTTFAGQSMAPGLHFLADLNKLVTSASQDLRETALVQAADATSRFVGELLFLVALALVSVGGVIAAGRVLTRPLKKLATTALQVHTGDFDVSPLPETGPKEVVTTTAAFNDMTSTLKAVEAQAVALAAEDLSHLEMLTPLPGRTGRALQASVDTLSARIREREAQRKQLHEAATHDPLTGLLNRSAVLDYLATDVSRRRDQGETVAVLFIDLDGLKPLNDTYGHEVGDTAILSTGVALMEATGECDVVGRLGGDEFLVVLCHDHSCDGDAVAERIRQSVAQRSIPVQDFVVPLVASVGIALAQCDSDTDPMKLVRQADEAMYEAKKAARAVRDRMGAVHS